MVRGNWQKRVETADARRKENKQRKQRSQEKKAYKLLSQVSTPICFRAFCSLGGSCVHFFFLELF